MNTLTPEAIRAIEEGLYQRLAETRQRKGETSQFTKLAQAQWEIVAELEKYVEGKAPQFASRFKLGQGNA